MSIARRSEPYQGALELPERLESIYKVAEAFRSIAVAWESISAGSWSAPAVQSFASMARRVALELSTLDCGALDKAVVELVLSLDAITVAGNVAEGQIARVDQALALIRGVATQRLLALELGEMAFQSDISPAMLHETCPRCVATGMCSIMSLRRRRRPAVGALADPQPL